MFLNTRGIFIVLIALLLGVTGCSVSEESGSSEKVSGAKLDTDIAKMSYSLGMAYGKGVKALELPESIGEPVERAAFFEAMNAVLDGSEVRLSQGEAREIQRIFSAKRVKRVAAARSSVKDNIPHD